MAKKKQKKRSRPITRIDPIRHLPPETVASIFLFAIQPFPNRPIALHPVGERWETAHIEPRRLLFGLASVSSSWRTFVCGTPQLWSTCWLRYEAPGFNSLWLSRTGEHCSLDLYAYPPFGCGPEFISPQPFLDSILPFAHRIRSLIIYSNVFKPPNPPLNIPADMLRFERLEVFRSILPRVRHGYSVLSMRMPTWLRAIAQGAERLQTFEAWEDDAQDVIDGCQLANMVNVCIYPPKHCEGLFKILQSAPTLQKIFWSTSLPPPPLPNIQHSHLTKLGLHIWGFGIEPEILGTLTLPALQYFRCFVDNRECVQAILSLFERSRCSIRALYIRTHGEPRDGPRIISILQSRAVLSTLELLDIMQPEYSLPFELLYFLVDRYHLPQLRRLSFGLKYRYPREEQEIVECLPLIKDLGTRTKKAGDKLRYVECFLKSDWGGAFLHGWKNSTPIRDRFKSLSKSTKGRLVYDPVMPRLQFGHLDIYEAYEDCRDKAEMEPWIISQGEESRRFVYYNQ